MMSQDPLFFTVMVKAAPIEFGIPVQKGFVASTTKRRSTEDAVLAAKRETDIPDVEAVCVATSAPVDLL